MNRIMERERQIWYRTSDKVIDILAMMTYRGFFCAIVNNLLVGSNLLK